MSDEETVEADRRKGAANVMATAAAMTDALIENTAKLDEVDNHLTKTSRIAEAGMDKVTKRQHAIWLTLIGVIIGVAILLVMFVQQRQSSREGHRLLNIIISCTNAEGTCSQASQAQLKKVIAEVTDQNNNGIPDNVEILDKLGGK